MARGLGMATLPITMLSSSQPKDWLTTFSEPSAQAELTNPTNCEPDPYPRLSHLLVADINQGRPVRHLPTINNSVLVAARKKFADTELAPNMKAMLDQPFGKDSINHSFTSVASFRLVLLPL